MQGLFQMSWTLLSDNTHRQRIWASGERCIRCDVAGLLNMKSTQPQAIAYAAVQVWRMTSDWHLVLLMWLLSFASPCPVLTRGGSWMMTSTAKFSTTILLISLSFPQHKTQPSAISISISLPFPSPSLCCLPLNYCLCPSSICCLLINDTVAMVPIYNICYLYR